MRLKIQEQSEMNLRSRIYPDSEANRDLIQYSVKAYNYSKIKV